VGISFMEEDVLMAAALLVTFLAIVFIWWMENNK